MRLFALLMVGFLAFPVGILDDYPAPPKPGVQNDYPSPPKPVGALNDFPMPPKP